MDNALLKILLLAADEQRETSRPLTANAVLLPALVRQALGALSGVGGSKRVAARLCRWGLAAMALDYSKWKRLAAPRKGREALNKAFRRRKRAWKRRMSCRRTSGSW